jgi:hypothetical protein
MGPSYIDRELSSALNEVWHEFRGDKTARWTSSPSMAVVEQDGTDNFMLPWLRRRRCWKEGE